MAAEIRGQPDDIKAALIHQPWAFSFIQAMRLLRRLCQGGDPTDGDGKLDPILVQPQLSLDFPTADVVGIEERNRNRIQWNLIVTFLGLYGSSSPLPTFYTEELLWEQSEGRSGRRDFFDLINSGLYDLLFKAWAKYQLGYTLHEEADPEVLERIYCLFGLSNVGSVSNSSRVHRFMRYAGLWTQMVRSAEGLRALLSDYLGVSKLEVLQCRMRLTEIPKDQHCRLGQSGNELGVTSSIGVQVLDRMNKFHIRLGPLSGSEFHHFLPDGKAYNEINELTALYVDRPLVWDTVLWIKREAIKSTSLGQKTWSRLGWDTWIFSRKPEELKLAVTL